MPDDPYENLASFGLTLKAHESRFGWFLRTFRVDKLLFVSGATSVVDGAPVARGRIGAEVSLEQGVASARQAAVNLVAAVHADTGDLRRWRPVNLRIYGALDPAFERFSEVATGASQLLVDVFGELYGAHTRTGVSMPNPANGAAVEVEAIFALRDGEGQ